MLPDSVIKNSRLPSLFFFAVGITELKDANLAILTHCFYFKKLQTKFVTLKFKSTWTPLNKELQPVKEVEHGRTELERLLT